MLSSLVAFFNKTSPSESLDSKKANAKKHIIYRDELSKSSKPALKKGGSDSSEPLITKEEGKKVMRVKVIMTKKEANRLLAQRKAGGVLEFKDVARELSQIPVGRVALVDTPSGCGRATVLKSIPEEF